MSEDMRNPEPPEEAEHPAPAGARLLLVLLPFLVVMALMLLEGWIRRA